MFLICLLSMVLTVLAIYNLEQSPNVEQEELIPIPVKISENKNMRQSR